MLTKKRMGEKQFQIAESDDIVLAKMQGITASIAEIHDLQTVKEIRDKAIALEAYFKESKASVEMVRAATVVQAQSERRLGELLKVMEKNGGAKTPRKNAVLAKDRVTTLKELGISKNLSSRAQTLASVPEKKFEAVLASEPDKELSIAKVALKIKEELRPSSAPQQPERKPLSNTSRAREKFLEVYNKYSDEWISEADKEDIRKLLRQLISWI